MKVGDGDSDYCSGKKRSPSATWQKGRQTENESFKIPVRGGEREREEEVLVYPTTVVAGDSNDSTDAVLSGSDDDGHLWLG